MAKKIMLTIMLAAAVSASAISARQLRTPAATPVACGHSCSTGTLCARPCGCCFGPGGFTIGTCQPECPAPARPK